MPQKLRSERAKSNLLDLLRHPTARHGLGDGQGTGQTGRLDAKQVDQAAQAMRAGALQHKIGSGLARA